MDFGMKYKFWKAFEQEMKPDLDVGRPSMLFEILVLSTPHIYDSPINLIKKANEAKIKNPKICRKYFDKWNETSNFFSELQKDLFKTEDRLMLDVYGTEGTGKSLYGGLTICKKLDPTFHAGRIRNTQRELIALVSEIQKEKTRGFKMMMRDENSREVGTDSWVSAQELHNELVQLREDQVGFCNVAPFTMYDKNYHFTVRMIDNTFYSMELPEERLETAEERVDWMCQKPQFARAIVSTLSARHGDRWKRQGPFGFIILPYPAIRFKSDNGVSKYEIDEEGKKLVIDYLKFKRQMNMKVSTGSLTRNDYSDVVMRMVKKIFENTDTLERYARFYLKTRRDKELGPVITGVNKNNAILLAKEITDSHNMWRNCSDNTIYEIVTEFDKKISLDLGLVDAPLAELSFTRDRVKQIYEEYEKATGDIGTETLGKEEYT